MLHGTSSQMLYRIMLSGGKLKSPAYITAQYRVAKMEAMKAACRDKSSPVVLEVEQAKQKTVDPEYGSRFDAFIAGNNPKVLRVLLLKP